ncbi:hypothetical protein KFL_000600300 [Klebsormidium nitens]|uniref:Elongator complex protein 5 n=1 Tax=Klebsormidium nitens TaxID=105231 RepID=A0A1Y1HRJ7_KLENI|nr:hypothetical protein KFL_000600300 [Klebsormidium nitens]|eukprot:GAQ80713.1 hypothetical protein KFL_000600300 [Klebsormidium nitens]
MENVVRSFKDKALENDYFNVVIVRDSAEVLGGPQVCQHISQELLSVVKKERAQARGTVLLALERAPEEYSHHLNQSSGSETEGLEPLQVLDCFSDPLGWQTSPEPDSSLGRTPKDETNDVSSVRARNQSQRAAEVGSSGQEDASRRMSSALGKLQRGGYSKVHFENDESLEGLKVGIQNAGEALLKDAVEGGRLALVIDSMSTLLQYCATSKVLAFLEWLRWSGRISTVLTLLHADLHDARTNAAFERLASTVVDVQAPPLLDERGSADGRIHVRHKTKKGKVRHEREQFWLETSGVRFGPIERTASVAELVAEKSTSMQSGRAPPSAKTATTPEVPFNLELSEAEKQSRARVVLPYEHQGDGHEVKIYDGRPALSGVQARGKRDGRIGYESGDESTVAAHNDKLKNGEVIESGQGHILYMRDSDEEPPDSDEDPDDDLDI